MQLKSTHVYVYFLPGAAGNFLSRCLNLLENFHCYVDPNKKVLPSSIIEKMELINYASVQNLEFNHIRSWIQFEKSILHFSEFDEPNKYVWAEQPPLLNNQTFVWRYHPFINMHKSNKQHNPFSGRGAVVVPKILQVYIDATNAWEWHILNALYKNSGIGSGWFIPAKKLLDDPTILKLNLANFIQGYDIFCKEFLKICNALNRSVNEQEQEYIKNLYYQWIDTTLPESKFNEFKQLLGFPANTIAL